MYKSILAILGPAIIVATTVIGIRMLAYWRSFLFHWPRYRQRRDVSTSDLLDMDVPFIKIQITTRGSAGSTEVVLRGIRNVIVLAQENAAFYGRVLSVEVVTESETQAWLLDREFSGEPVRVETLCLPANYQTPNDTQLKARALHYAVEWRRAGWNRKPGRTFIVHYDEESTMVPSELRKLLAVLTETQKKILEGPIHYPLEYADASAVCRAMEANRPIGCFECRHVMEKGVPLHLHGSNLVVEEQFENELGWDIGSLDGQPLIAEDYVFGMNAFLHGGRETFGWHGCVMLEQPPFSFKSAFKQRHRWIFGVLQGIVMARRQRKFNVLPISVRNRLVWGTRFRIATFVMGSVIGTFSLLLLPRLVATALITLGTGKSLPLSPVVMVWMAIVGGLWLGSVAIGAWYNVSDTSLSRAQRCTEIARTVVLAPVAGISESTAALHAVIKWLAGRREVAWQPTPKTKAADKSVDWSRTI